VAVAVVLALAAPVATTAHAAARPGTFAGSLGIKVPKGAHADVRAVERATGIVAAARRGRSAAPDASACRLRRGRTSSSARS